MFVDVIEADRRQREFQSILISLARIPEQRMRELDVSLSLKRQVQGVVSPSSNIGRFLNTVGGGSTAVIQSRINQCLSAIDRTIDTNIIALTGIAFDAAGLDTLLSIQSTLGSNFTSVANTLNNVYNFGPNALNQLQQAFATGVQNTILGAVSIATQAANETIQGVSDAVFCALLPSLNQLQTQVAGILGPVADITNAVTDLTQQVTNTINNTLNSLQSEVDNLSATISQGLFGYASNRGSTCADRPDSQLGIRDAISSSLGCS